MLGAGPLLHPITLALRDLLLARLRVAPAEALAHHPFAGHEEVEGGAKALGGWILLHLLVVLQVGLVPHLRHAGSSADHRQQPQLADELQRGSLIRSATAYFGLLFRPRELLAREADL